MLINSKLFQFGSPDTRYVQLRLPKTQCSEMARAAGKKAVKSSTQPASAQSKTSANAGSDQMNAPPEQFKPIPVALRPLVAKLPTNHVYAFHVDKTDPSLKRRVYVVPVLLNIAITAVLVWRAYSAAPVYLDQILTIFGHDTPWKVQPSTMGFSDLASTLSERTFLLMFDYAIFALLGSWPWEFLFGSKYTRHTGAAAWRWTLGFRPVEVVVRIGRKWDQTLLREIDENRVERERSSKWKLDEELNFRFKIESALRRSYTGKTGYLLLDKEWDLDFRAMIDTNHLVDRGVIVFDDVDHIVLLCWQNQWMVRHVTDVAAETDIKAATAHEDASLRNFRDRLTELKAEDVFFRWIEIVQYESSLPGGFSPKKQAESLVELKELLRERRIEFTTFLQDIGGEKQIPGLT